MHHQLAKTDLQLADLTKLRNSLQQELQEIKNAESFELFKSWDLTTETKLVMFAKNPNCCYQTILTLDVTDINFEQQTVVGREGHYFLQIDPCFRSTYTKHEFSYLYKFEDSFNVYVVPNDMFTEVVQLLCELQISSNNCSEYEACVAERALRKIS